MSCQVSQLWINKNVGMSNKVLTCFHFGSQCWRQGSLSGFGGSEEHFSQHFHLQCGGWCIWHKCRLQLLPRTLLHQNVAEGRNRRGKAHALHMEGPMFILEPRIIGHIRTNNPAKRSATVCRTLWLPHYWCFQAQGDSPASLDFWKCRALIIMELNFPGLSATQVKGNTGWDMPPRQKCTMMCMAGLCEELSHWKTISTNKPVGKLHLLLQWLWHKKRPLFLPYYHRKLSSDKYWNKDHPEGQVYNPLWIVFLTYSYLSCTLVCFFICQLSTT